MAAPGRCLKNQSANWLDEFVFKRCDLRGRDIIRKTAGLIPAYPAEKFHAEGVLVAGDAAGMVNPFTGGGLFYGMLSSKMSARTAIGALQANRFDSLFLRQYTRRIKRSPFYLSLKAFHALISYSRWHHRITKKPIRGKLFKLHSDLGIFALNHIKVKKTHI